MNVERKITVKQRRFFIRALILLICALTLFSCAPPTPTPASGGSHTVTTQKASAATVSRTDGSAALPARPVSYEDGFKDGKHIDAYFDLSFASRLADDWQVNTFRRLFEYSSAFTLGYFLDYYMIPMETLEAALAETESHDFNYAASQVEVWYGDHADDPAFIWDGYVPIENSASVTLRPSGESDFTDLYYTVDSALIDFVGEKAFAGFKDRFGGTGDFNIVNFIRTFGVTEEDYYSLYYGENSPGNNGWTSPVPVRTLYDALEDYGAMAMAFRRRPAHNYSQYVRRDGMGQSDPYFVPDGKHSALYWNDPEIFITTLMGETREASRIVEMLRYTEGFNPGGVIDLFGLDRDSWYKTVNAVEEIMRRGGKPEGDYVIHEPWGDYDKLLEYSYLIWGGADYRDRTELLQSAFDRYSFPKSVTVRCPSDNRHTDLWYTIDWILIDYVGENAFMDFKNRFAGTEDFNIAKFTEFFGISRIDMYNIYGKNRLCSFGPFPYNFEYIWAPDDVRDQYFVRKQAPLI